MDCFLSFGSGIMVASNFFSLLNPAIDLSFKQNQISWIVVSIGLLLGGLLIILTDLLLNKILKTITI